VSNAWVEAWPVHTRPTPPGGWMTERLSAESLRGREQPDDDPLDLLRAQVAARLGLCPSFFMLARHDLRTARGLWQLAEFGYLDNPADSRAKEELFVYLSKFCTTRYCVARHAGFLLGRGRAAGDARVRPFTPEAVVALLDEPLPEGDALTEVVAELLAVDAPLTSWPTVDSPLGRPFRVAAAIAFLRPPHAREVLAALRHLLGAAGYEQLMLFLGFVRFANFWTEVHPEIEFEQDLEGLLSEHALLERAVRARPPSVPASLQRRLEIERPALEQIRHEVAGLRAAESTLAARIEHLDAVTAHAPVFIAEVDTSLRYRFANRPYAALFGGEPSGLVGMRVRDVIGQEAFDIVAPHMETVLAGEAVEFETSLNRAPGEALWLRSSYAPIRNLEGRVTGFVAGIVDITQRRAAETAHRESEARLRAAQAAAGIGIFDWDIPNDNLVWDERLCAIWGVPAAEVSFATFVAGLHPDDLFATRVAVERAMNPQGPGSYDAEYRVIHRTTGAITWIHASGQVSFLRDQPMRMLGAVFDVTQRREAEEAHAISEERLRLAADAAGFGTYYHNLDTHEFDWSPEAKALLGLDPNEVMTEERLRERLHPADRNRVRARIRAHLRAAAPSEYEDEFRVLLKSGNVRWILAKGRMFSAEEEDGDGPRIVAGTLLDITARKRAEERQALLVNELNHRVKNMIAVVQSLASQTILSANAANEDFGAAFSARLRALASAHDLLTRGGWEGATLADVISGVLAPFSASGRPQAVVARGPEVRLSPNAAVTLSLAFHELATNATKYGALATAHGRIDIAWRFDASSGPEVLEVDWIETGGPAVTEPQRRGFGSRLVERALAREFDGTAQIRFPRTGVECRMRLKLSDRIRKHSS
jgi:PAS domain S-box-containing protein